MPSLDQLQAFISAADEGSFSAASRSLHKAQSAISTAIINLEIDVGTELFDRSSRNPVLTESGEALLKYARSVLASHKEFLSHASSLSGGIESRLNIAIEEGTFVRSLRQNFSGFADKFPSVEVEILAPGPNDVANLLIEGRTDLGLMMEREDYPQGFHFNGVGHTRLIPVCGRSVSLADIGEVTHADLRRHRQLVTRSRHLGAPVDVRNQYSPQVWYCENPYSIKELLVSGLGWAVLPQTVVASELENGELVQLKFAFQKSDMLRGVDVVWTAKRSLGVAGQWFLNKLLNLPPGLWSE